jgi:threonine dehydrogenase-like Zn-dependent dehydrogenase
MKALVWKAPRLLALREQTEPEPQADEVVLQVAYAGICGSELSGYLGHSGIRTPPLVMGHEFSGTIVARGDACAARWPSLAEGQRVTANPMISCGNCGYCRSAAPQLCPARKLIGAHRPGAYAEYVAVPARSVLPLPQAVSLRTGALVEPVAVGVRIGETAGDVAGQDALVIGAGPIGLLALQMLRLRGSARVFIADLDPARLAMGAELGGVPLNAREVNVVQIVCDATSGGGVPVSVDAVGTATTRAQCVAATRAAGTVLLSGLHEETSAIPAAEIIRKEIIVRGCFCYSPANFAEALDLLARGAVRLDPWIVEAPLAEGGTWFDRLLDAPGAVAKVLLTP